MSRELPPPAVLPCPLCSAQAYRPIKQFSDGVVVGKCLRCALLYTPLRHRSPESLLSGGDPGEMRLLLRPITRGVKRHYRDRSFLSILTLVQSHAPGRRILDIGCAQGFFLRLARDRGYQVTGIEPAPALAAFARDEWGVEVLDGRLDQVALTGREWDAITFTDSLEYLPDPVADLTRLVAHLPPAGVLLAKVPNGHYFSLRHRLESRLGRMRGREESFSPSRRVVHYTLRSLRRLVVAVGLEWVRGGAAPVVDSPVWSSMVGLWLETESPWYVDTRGKLARRLLRALGVAEQVLSGWNHFSPSIYVIARKPTPRDAAAARAALQAESRHGLLD